MLNINHEDIYVEDFYIFTHITNNLMKKYLYLIFIATALFSCTKEEAQSPDNLRLQMVDKWLYRNAKVINYSATGVATDSAGIAAGTKDFFEFKEDGSFSKSTENGKELTTGTFTTSTITRFMLKEAGTNYICRVINLNLENFVFVKQEPKVAGQPYKETRFTLYR